MSILDKRILITGGAGFIGSHLCEALVANNEIISLDNYFTGSPNNHILGVKYIKGSSQNVEKISLPDIDYVFHLGEYARVEQSFHDFAKVLEYNCQGTQAILRYCLKNNAKLIYAASSTKFANGGDGRSQSPYAWTKATNTELIKNTSNWFSLKYVITYFYNAFGPREINDGNYATLIALFCRLMKEKRKLTIVSPGTQVRHFTHVKDIVSGMLLAAEFGNGDGFGIGNPDSYSVLDVAKMFKGEIEMLPERKGNRMMGELVTEKLENLGWIPKYKLDDYIETMRNQNWQY